jgi:DNA-binding NtrC family response regulator
VDDDEDLAGIVSCWLGGAGIDVECVASGEECLATLGRSLPDAVCLDLSLPGLSGLETLDRLRTRHAALPVIILTAERTIDTVVDAMRRGAYDYVPKPLDETKLVTTVKNAAERSRLEARVRRLEREASGKGYPGLLGRSGPMTLLFRQLDRVATTDITVLLHGESGTGKELAARALHTASQRRSGPFVALNCAAIPETLQEAELFGHEKGAFTGAATRRVGRLEEADGGTLFLDEVAEMPLGLQAKLLRALQEKAFARVGSGGEVRSDFRLVAATHRDLFREVGAGRFREDLFYRIAVFELAVPPLRERGEDVLLLAGAFLDEIAETPGGRRFSLAVETRTLFLAHDWPGNVRELRNALQHASVLAAGEEIHPDDLPRRIREARARRADGDVAATAPRETEDSSPVLDLAAMERHAVEDALRRTGWDIAEAVRLLGIGRTTLYRKIKDYGLRP